MEGHGQISCRLKFPYYLNSNTGLHFPYDDKELAMRDKRTEDLASLRFNLNHSSKSPPRLDLALIIVANPRNKILNASMKATAMSAAKLHISL